METVKFGKTGMQVSKLCLGCMTYGSTKWREWVLEEEASRPFIREALEKGINFFDTADVYSQGVSEEILGRALKEYAKRPEVVIATKVHGAMGPNANAKGLSRKHIMEAIDASLKRLGTDYVDLYQIHRFDPLTPMEETLDALNDVVRAGKALYIGASSMYAWQFARMIDIAHQLVAETGREPGGYEFQMLHGIRAAEQRALVAGGETVRVYVPFGDDWYAGGELDVRFVKPVQVNDTVTPHVRCTARDVVDGASRITLDCWCQVADGSHVVEGSARCTVGAGARSAAAP